MTIDEQRTAYRQSRIGKRVCRQIGWGVQPRWRCIGTIISTVDTGARGSFRARVQLDEPIEESGGMLIKQHLLLMSYPKYLKKERASSQKVHEIGSEKVA